MPDAPTEPEEANPGHPSTDELFALVYDELKKVANFKMSFEPQGQRPIVDPNGRFRVENGLSGNFGLSEQA